MKLDDGLFQRIYDKNKIYSIFVKELRLKGYQDKEIMFLKEPNEVLNTMLDNILINRLKELINKKTYKRFDKLINGKNLIFDLICNSNCYKLVIDDEEVKNFENTILFTTKDGKRAYFKHEEECQKGLIYIENLDKWQ